jgi:DeoR/GlpR family transcriptional regulator of sugar metabolism
MEAARQGEAELLCVGGELRKINGALVSEAKPWEFSPTVRADFAFIGASGLERCRRLLKYAAF